LSPPERKPSHRSTRKSALCSRRGWRRASGKPDQALPSESKLAQRFHVSIGTIRHAIDELVAEQILVRHQGRGTFVASHTPKRMLYRFFHIAGEDG